MSLTITAPREVVLSFFKLVATVCLFLFPAHAFAAQQPRENSQTKYVVERLELIGNRRVEPETLRALISSGPGDPYSVEAVRRDVRDLWEWSKQLHVEYVRFLNSRLTLDLYRRCSGRRS
jgi:outer membrane protein assembly factor BamA